MLLSRDRVKGRGDGILTWNEEGRPANDDQEVLPVDIVETDGGGLQQDNGSYH